MRPTHFPPEPSLATNPPDHYIPPPRMPAQLSTVGYDTSITRSPLRRNQTLPAANLARGPDEQSHHLPSPVRPAVNGHQQSSFPTGSSTHFEAQVATPPEAPPTPSLDQRLSRTLYLTNPDARFDAHGSHVPPLPPAPKSVSTSRRRRQSEQAPQIHLDNVYVAQPQVVVPDTTTQTEIRHRSSPRNSPPVAPTDRRQEARHYDPPSQTLAAMNAQRVGLAVSATSASSSRSSSSLTPRHIPKRLVMPTPLADAAETSLPMAGSEGSNPSAVSSRLNVGRPVQLLRKRSVSGVMSRPQRTQVSAPSETVNRGIFGFFGFSKGSKPTVPEIRVTDPMKRVISEKQGLSAHTRQEPRKLSKRK
jgi:hypothetical protein